MAHIAVVGAGSWGTAIAALLGEKGLSVRMWARSHEVADGIAHDRRNPRYLTDRPLVLADSVTATTDLAEAVRGADTVVMATPSKAMRTAAEAVAEHYASQPVVSLAKGLEPGSNLRMTEVLDEVLGDVSRLAALSGPNHAEEVAQRIPSATVIAAYDQEVARRLQGLFMSPYFRVYTNPDVVGVELCGASKNVIAVATGISDGLGYGDNTRAALMTRGLAEMARLGRAVNADNLTYMGLAGMGDLVVTCTSRHSRNRRLGEMVGRGELPLRDDPADEFFARTHMVAEGAFAAVTIDELAKSLSVEMPITRQVRGILREGVHPSAAVEALMTRSATDERHGMGLVDDGGGRQ